MIQKRVLVAGRVRRPPASGWSWIDRRFFRKFAPLLSQEGILLYFFLAAVSDKQGLSFYSAGVTAKHLHMPERQVVFAREELVRNDLVAYRNPLTQVLSIREPPARGGGPESVANIFRALAQQ